MTPPAGRHQVLALVVHNALAAACVLAAPAAVVPGPLRMAAAALLVLVLPGAGWLGLWRRPLDAPRLALAVIGLSSMAAVAGTALGAWLTAAPSTWFLAAWCLVIMNAGLLLARRRPRLDPHTPWRLLAAILVAGFAVIAATGLYLVPPLEDHDMEVRGTAFGLAADFKPYFQTNRQVYFPFAHPLLFHFHVADSLLFTGEIEATRPSYDSARRSEAARARGEEVPWMEWWREDHQAFVEQPALAGTRAPAALFGALVLALLADLIRRLTGSKVAGAAGAILYLSAPETLVRSAYAGYFSITVFAMLVAVMLLTRESGSPATDDGATSPDAPETPPPVLGWLLAAGFFAALVDHKTVVLILGILAVAGLRALAVTLKSGRPQELITWWWQSRLGRSVLALGCGFTAGTFTWWTYAALVDAPTFIADHLRMHIAHRILLNDVRLAGDAQRYAPSIPEVWWEFAAHTGFLLLPVALLAFAVWAWRAPRDDRGAVLLAWFLTGAVLYSLTDWRQTKHLMNQLAPLVAAALFLAWPAGGLLAQGGKRKILSWVAMALLAVALLINVANDVRLVNDFSSLRVSGASDVDGW